MTRAVYLNVETPLARGSRLATISNTPSRPQIRKIRYRHVCSLTCFALFSMALAGCGEKYESSPSADISSPVMNSGATTESAPVHTPATARPVSATDRSAFESKSSAAGLSDRGMEHDDTVAARTTRDEAPFRPSSGRQSGVLTAGSFDDVAHFDDYRSFLRRHQHAANRCGLPLPPDTQQTVITITDGQGRPLGNVRCVVKQCGGQQTERVLLDRATGSDGRVMLLSDGRPQHHQQAQPLHLQVYANGKTEAVIDEYRNVDNQWRLTLQDQQSTLPTQLDLALVVDTTGSMGDELEYLKTEIDSIVASVSRMFPEIDQRFSLITYRDNGDEYVCRSFDFTGSLSDFRRNLDAQSAHGGGDFPEAMDVALQNAEQLSWRRGNTARVLFLVGDAPPHAEQATQTMSAITGLSQKGVRIFPVGASGVEQTAQVILRTASLLSMGQYLFLTDHSGVGNAHATPDVPSFAVERLDRLMLRMIASELAGKRLAAEEVIAIERGEQYSYTAPPACQSPAPSRPLLSYCVVTPKSPLTIIADWFTQNLLVTVVAVVSGAVVFERLSHLMLPCVE